ncbi:MAG: hydantoinase/oxoprolinase family protein [Armatimonadota bacterium]|nr:hydantoinase/oxoprolinase family protein [Armatimonadota bacterium]
MYVVGIDVGGTFTDVAVLDLATHRTVTAKSLTTPDDLTAGVWDALGLAAHEAQTTVGQLLAGTVRLAHATTQTSNALLTFSGARVGLLTTRGFEDQLLIMRGIGRVAGLSLLERRHPRATSKPPLIVDETRIRGLRERIDAQGHVVTPLDVEHARAQIADLLQQGVEAFAVCLLWAFVNPTHERAVAALIRQMAPEAHVSLSHEIAPFRGEYERTATTVVNAYVAPTLERYLTRLAAQLREAGLRVPVLVVQANGGVTAAARVVPVQTIESGPAVGVAAARAVAQATGRRQVIATDVGGTTFKVSLLTEGKWATTRETVIAQYSLWLPMVDVVSIGAGGGSVAWVDDTRLRVGPRSVGAVPGPACYGRGGTEPTVTDADVVLGYINPETFWGGRMRLDADAAARAIGTHVATRLFQNDVVRAAAGIREVVDQQMADLIRKVVIERGYDPRDFVLFAYGGMGPVHGATYARAAGIGCVLVPGGASVLSAVGAARSDILHSLAVSDLMLLPADPERLRRHYQRMEAEAAAMLDADGLPLERRVFARWVEMRYRRQLHAVRVELSPDALAAVSLDQVARAFEDQYAALYGATAAYREAGIEIVAIGLDAWGLVDPPPFPAVPAGGPDPSAARKGHRPVYCMRRHQWVETPVYDGPQLRAGNAITGLALVEYPHTTVVVDYGARAEVDGFGNIVMTVLEGARE